MTSRPVFVPSAFSLTDKDEPIVDFARFDKDLMAKYEVSEPLHQRLRRLPEHLDDDDGIVSSSSSTGASQHGHGRQTQLDLADSASGYAREQRVPRAMVLRAIGPSTSEPTLENAEMADLIDVELLPSVPRTALTLAANLKPEQGFDAMSDPVVMRLNNSRASGFVHEFDETLVDNRAH
jgi:hypothetical protein